MLWLLAKNLKCILKTAEEKHQHYGKCVPQPWTGTYLFKVKINRKYVTEHKDGCIINIIY